jgi:putative MATE family efflux protein
MGTSDLTKALGTEPIRKLILRLATPSIVSLGVLAFYNVVDAIFVGHGAGTLAIAGIGVAFPVFLLIIGIGQLVGVGGASLLSRALGRKDKALAEKTLGNTITLGVIVSALIAVLGLLNRVRLVRFAGATSEILPHALSYVAVILGGAFTIVLASIFAATVRAQGDAVRATVPLIVGGVLNIGLDPVFIFGLRMGAAGAAWATVISSGAGVAYYAYYVMRRNASVSLRLRSLVLNARTAWAILGVGAASFVGIFAASASTVVINRALGACGGDLPIAIYSVVNRIVMFSRMPVFGVVDGVQPIYGYNYGAGNYPRVVAAIRHALVSALALAGVFWALFLLIPRGFLSVFSADPLLLSQGARALRIIVMVIPLLALQAIVGGFHQALGHAAKALAVSLLRDVILLVPGVLILSAIFDTTGVWMAFPIADFVSAIVVSPLLIHEIRKLRRMNPALDSGRTD